MTLFSELFNQSADWLWFILAAILMLLELAIPGLFLVWLAVAALFMGIAMFLIPVAISWQLQVLLFAIISIMTVIIGKKYLNYGNNDVKQNGLNKPGHRLIGSFVRVDQVLSPDKGKAKIGDSVWTIIGNDLVQDAEMQVVDLEGNALVVEAVNK